MDNLQTGGKNDSFDLQEVLFMSVVDGRTPGNDIWSHFADFLSELIARHAEELDIDSWPDPKKIIAFQELQDLYHRFMKFRRKKVTLITIFPLKFRWMYAIVRIYSLVRIFR